MAIDFDNISSVDDLLAIADKLLLSQNVNAKVVEQISQSTSTDPISVTYYDIVNDTFVTQSVQTKYSIANRLQNSVSETPTAGKIPIGNSAGKLDKRWFVYRYATTDPTVNDSAPTVGVLWINLTTGEIWIYRGSKTASDGSTYHLWKSLQSGFTIIAPQLLVDPFNDGSNLAYYPLTGDSIDNATTDLITGDKAVSTYNLELDSSAFPNGAIRFQRSMLQLNDPFKRFNTNTISIAFWARLDLDSYKQNVSSFNSDQDSLVDLYFVSQKHTFASFISYGYYSDRHLTKIGYFVSDSTAGEIQYDDGSLVLAECVLPNTVQSAQTITTCCTTNFNLMLDRWHLIVMNLDIVNQILEYWIDGVLVARTAEFQPVHNSQDDNDYPLTFGFDANSSSDYTTDSRLFYGWLAHLHIFNRTLTVDDIAQLYKLYRVW